MKNGWHTIYGNNVYVEDGKVLRGVSHDHQRTEYPYRWIGNPYKCYTLASGIGVEAFRSGVRRGTVMMK